MAAQCSTSAESRQPAQWPAVYRPRRPAETVLYRVVQEHLETYLALAREGYLDEDPVPSFVERDFRRYLQCGVLCYGFARAYCANCGHDFLIAFSCKGRGVCPSCNARRMVETAAHLVDHVFPWLPVRQWVLALPKRLRYFLHHNPKIATAVLHIFLRVIELRLRHSSPGAGPRSRLGAVSFMHRFGSSLNPHFHFHVCVIDGVFEQDADGHVHFHQAQTITEAEIAAVQETVRRRVLKLFVRHALLEPEQAQAMRQWDNSGGFSVDACVRVEAWDRAGLERLLRYCARAPFALERLAWAEENPEILVYQLPKPLPDGRTALDLTPLELLERLAALIPPPRIHRHRYHGVLAPNAPEREQVTARAREEPAHQAPSTEASPGQSSSQPIEAPSSGHTNPSNTARPRSAFAGYLWAMLLARIYAVSPLCPYCGQEIQLIAFVTDSHSIRRILEYLGEPTQPPPLSQPRGPPEWAQSIDQTPPFDPTAGQPETAFEFDQTISW